MYFRLQQLHKALFSDYNKSITFLTGLAGTNYTNQINTLITTIENYKLDIGKSGLLPEYLCIPAMASRLNQFAQRRMANSLMPYVNCLNFNDQYPEGFTTFSHQHQHQQSPQAYRIGNTPPNHRRRQGFTSGRPFDNNH